jgi:hypothetical protein
MLNDASKEVTERTDKIAEAGGDEKPLLEAEKWLNLTGS